MGIRMMNDTELREVLKADRERQALKPKKRKSNVIDFKRKS